MNKNRLHWAVLSALCMSSHAYALPEDNVRLKLDYNFSRDSNYFRVANDAHALALIGSTDTAVTIRRAGLGMDADLRVGRQEITLRSSFIQVDFDRVILKPATELNLQANWNWVIGNKLSGSLSHRLQHELQSQADAQSAQQNKQKQSFSGLSASYQIHPSIYLDAGITNARYAFTPTARQVLDRTERGYSLGWRWPTSAGNFVGMQYRKTEGDYPNQMPARPFEQTELMLNGSWSPNGVSRYAWSAGQTRRIDGAVTLRQPTWSFTSYWMPTGKLKLDSSFGKSVASSETTSAATTTATHNAAVGATWLATSKLTLNGNIRSQDIQYDDTGRTDQIRGSDVTLSYQAMRSLQATLGYGAERRSSSIGIAEYRYERWNLGLQAAF